MKKNKIGKGAGSLGRSIMRSMHKKYIVPKTVENVKFVHIEETEPEKDKINNLASIIEQNSLNEFLQMAELSSKNFEAMRNTKLKTEQVCKEEEHTHPHPHHMMGK